MTAEQTTDPMPVRIGGEKSTRDKSLDRFPFYLGDNDTVLIGTRPPMATLLRLVAAMQDDSDVMAMAAAYNHFLEKVLDEDSAAHVRARMEDEDDELDLDHPDLATMFKHLVEVWYGTRPTGGPGGSSPRSSRTGKRSTVRSRSAG